MDVGCVEFVDVFDVCVVELYWYVECDCVYDCCFVCGVDVFDVEGWIGFCVVEFLCGF